LRRRKPENYEFAKELIAGFAGAEVDKLIETKGQSGFYLHVSRLCRYPDHEDAVAACFAILVPPSKTMRTARNYR